MSTKIDKDDEGQAVAQAILRLATAVTRDLVAANIGPKNTYEFAQAMIKVIEDEK